MQSYLCKTFQKTINGSFSSWSETIAGVRQVSILGPLLIKIFLNDTFLFIANSISANLESNFLIMHKPFHENQMVSEMSLHANRK